MLTDCHICKSPCKYWGPLYNNFCKDCANKIRKLAGSSWDTKESGDGFWKNSDYWDPYVGRVKAEFNKEKLYTEPSRAALANRVIHILKEHMYPYGGYVRDAVAGDKFKDLDLFMPNHGTDGRWNKNIYLTLSDMANKLSDDGLTVVSVPSSESAYSTGSDVLLTKKKYKVLDKNGTLIEIDLVKSNKIGSKDHPYPSLDADVNSLAFDKDGVLWSVTGLPLEEVIDHINNRVFKIPSDSYLKGERVNKLLEKGYRALSSEINTSSLQEGDRVRIEIKSNGISYYRNATVLIPGTHSSVSATVALDEPFDDNDHSSTPPSLKEKTIAEKWGHKFNGNDQAIWIAGGSERSYTVVESVLKKVHERETLTYATALPGARVRCIGSYLSGYNGKFAKIVEAKPYSIIVEWEDGSQENTKFSYASSFQFIEAAPPNTINNKVEMKKHNIQFDKLQEGDLVELIINDPSEDYDTGEEIGEVKLEATFLRVNDNGDAIFALKEEYNSDELGSSRYYDLNEGQIDRFLAEKYSLSSEKSIYWTVEEKTDAYTQISKVIKHQKPLTASQKEEKQNTMSNIDWSGVIMQDAGKATIRTGANLGINGLKAGLAKVLAAEGVDGPGAQAVMKFFNGEFGEALLRAGLGYSLLGLPIPFIQENEYAQKVSEELRVSGLSKGMDKGAAMLQQFIMPALLEAFKDTPLLEGIMNGGKSDEKIAEAIKPRVAESVAPQRIAAPPVADESVDVEFEETARAGARAAL